MNGASLSHLLPPLPGFTACPAPTPLGGGPAASPSQSVCPGAQEGRGRHGTRPAASTRHASQDATVAHSATPPSPSSTR